MGAGYAHAVIFTKISLVCILRIHIQIRRRFELGEFNTSSRHFTGIEMLQQTPRDQYVGIFLRGLHEDVGKFDRQKARPAIAESESVFVQPGSTRVGFIITGPKNSRRRFQSTVTNSAENWGCLTDFFMDRGKGGRNCRCDCCLRRRAETFVKDRLLHYQAYMSVRVSAVIL